MKNEHDSSGWIRVSGSTGWECRELRAGAVENYGLPARNTLTTPDGREKMVLFPAFFTGKSGVVVKNLLPLSLWITVMSAGNDGLQLILNLWLNRR